MKRIKIKNPIPRPLRACVYAFLAIVLAIAYYIALGCPTMSMKQEFRRAERAHLVGPSKIVDTMNGEYREFDRMFVGETEHGISFFGRYYNNYPYGDLLAEKQYYFTYVEKTGDLTIAAAPNVWGVFWSTNGYNVSVPVYLFDEYHQAVRAELSVRVIGAHSYYSDGEKIVEGFDRTFHAKATRNEDGFFRFYFEAKDEEGLNALHFFSNLTGSTTYGITEEMARAALPATVRLYDAEDNLILEKTLTIRSVSSAK